MRHTRTAIVIASLGVSALALTACSTDSEPVTPTPETSASTVAPESSPAPQPSTAEGSESTEPAEASPSPEEGLPTPAPILLDETTTDAAVGVGGTLVITVADPVGTRIEASPEGILEVTQGSDDGTTVLNPGAKVIGAGTATLTITRADGTSSTITIVAEEAPVVVPGLDEEGMAALCQDILNAGISVDEAAQMAIDAGATSRPGSVDGAPAALTMDYNPQRVTLDVTDGIVTGCTVG